MKQERQDLKVRTRRWVLTVLVIGLNKSTIRENGDDPKKDRTGDRQRMGSRKKRYYEEADIEQAYQEQAEKMGEADLERLLQTGRVRCLYRTATTKTENEHDGTCLLESQIYPAFYNQKDLSGGRAPKTRKTSRHQRDLNDKNSKRCFIRTACANFGSGDIFATFNWDKDHLPSCTDDADRDVRNFFKRIRYHRKRKGCDAPLRYMYIIAIDGYVHPHVHILMSGDGLSRDEVESLWHAGSRPNTRRIVPDKDFQITGLAKYISANPRGSKRWRCSKGLKRPETTKSYSKFRRRTVNKMVRDHVTLVAELEKAYPGYRYLDSEIRYNGIAAAFYIYARMARIRTGRPEKDKSKGGRGKRI